MVSYIQRELGRSLDLTGGPDLLPTEYTVWSPSNPRDTPEFDENGVILGIDSNNEGNPRPQGSRQGDLEEGTGEDDRKIPRLIPDPRNQNPYAALADNSGEETPRADVSHHNSPEGGTSEGPHTYASMASSSLGSADADNQPSWTKLTPLPDSGVPQRQSSTGAQAHKRERTPKNKRTSNTRNTATPNAIASITRDVCNDILSPIIGNRYGHAH